MGKTRVPSGWFASEHLRPHSAETVQRPRHETSGQEDVEQASRWAIPSGCELLVSVPVWKYAEKKTLFLTFHTNDHLKKMFLRKSLNMINNCLLVAADSNIAFRFINKMVNVNVLPTEPQGNSALHLNDRNVKHLKNS